MPNPRNLSEAIKLLYEDDITQLLVAGHQIQKLILEGGPQECIKCPSLIPALTRTLQEHGRKELNLGLCFAGNIAIVASYDEVANQLAEMDTAIVLIRSVAFELRRRQLLESELEKQKALEAWEKAGCKGPEPPAARCTNTLSVIKKQDRTIRTIALALQAVGRIPECRDKIVRDGAFTSIIGLMNRRISLELLLSLQLCLEQLSLEYEGHLISADWVSCVLNLPKKAWDTAIGLSCLRTLTRVCPLITFKATQLIELLLSLLTKPSYTEYALFSLIEFSKRTGGANELETIPGAAQRALYVYCRLCARDRATSSSV